MWVSVSNICHKGWVPVSGARYVFCIKHLSLGPVKERSGSFSL
nr:MAG TPA: hypothetical protein [Caudoviricetes sp.]